MYSLNLRSGGGMSVFLATTTKSEKGGLLALRPTSAEWRVLGREDVRSGRNDVRFPVRRQRSSSSMPGYFPFVVAARNGNHSSSGKDGPSIPDEDGLDGTTPQYDKSKSYDYNKSNPILSDWREFRATLVAREQEQVLDSDAVSTDATSPVVPSQRLGLKWAHAIPVPETGCVLVATEKFDYAPKYERTVILLLRLGSRDPKERPFGVILNRPRRKNKGMVSPTPDLIATFSDSTIHSGGPLDAGLALVRAGGRMPLAGFDEVISGVYFGIPNNILEAAPLVKRGVLKAQDFKFFSGYVGWQFDELQEDIKSGHWVVAACSSHLITADFDSSLNLWEEILQLMGGHYSELSRKPKRGSL